MRIVNFRVIAALVFPLTVASHLVFAQNQASDTARYRFESPTQNNVAHPPGPSDDPRCKELATLIDRAARSPKTETGLVQREGPNGKKYTEVGEKTLNPREGLDAEYLQHHCR